MKPSDSKALNITFGVELETTVPLHSGFEIGGYHRGPRIGQGVRQIDQLFIPAPNFNGTYWRAERDGSIRYTLDQKPCEFVSPILHGEAGVERLCEFVEWAKAIGAQVNDSCGCHITVSVDSIIGTSDNQARSEFARKLAHLVRWHSRAIFGQTGTGRHQNNYSRAFSPQVGELVKTMETSHASDIRERAATECGRGIVNFRKLYSSGLIEFRAFAGTLNTSKLLHHLATVLGLCRRAHEVQKLGAFKKNKLQESRTRTALESLQFLWNYLGWTGRNRPVAMGLFGRLHAQFGTYGKTAMRMCNQFDQQFPHADL